MADTGPRKRRRSLGVETDTLAYRKAPGTPSRFPVTRCDQHA